MCVLFSLFHVSWFVHCSILPKRSCILGLQCLTSLILRVEAVLGWLPLLERESDVHCVALAEGVGATCQGGVIPTHTHHAVPVLRQQRCQASSGEEGSSYNVMLFSERRASHLKAVPNPRRSASLNWSHLLALVGVGTDKCLSVSACGCFIPAPPLLLPPPPSPLPISLCLPLPKWLDYLR